MKLRVICLATLMCAFSSAVGQETNIYSGIIKRNAFNLTDKEPVPTLPPAEKILAPSVFLTGITRMNGVEKIHFVLRKKGDPDKFVSLATNEKQYKVELKKINKNSALISNNGSQTLLSFEKNSLPTAITKIASPRVTKPDTDGSERKRQYDEWRKSRSKSASW